ncbi:MAG: hypothetical protein L6R41_007190 [Letrouitia leprolyta]|nr:MAG: hypothetical protein L6R41_007190 [Letrouitia leprolyta]
MSPDQNQSNLSTMPTQEALLQAASKNAELLQGLNATAFASSALQQSQAYLDDLNREIAKCDSQIKQLETKTTSELSDHKKYAESTMRRFMHRAVGRKERFAEKASKEEREYVEALAAENRAKARRDEWIKDRDEEREEHTELEHTDRVHKDLQAQLDALYHSIFDGPSPGFPGEDDKEWALRQAQDAFNHAKCNHEAETQGVKCLTDATRFMSQAIFSLDDARRLSRLDMLGGGTLTDVMERDALSRAQVAVDKAKMLVLQAQRLSPDIQGLSDTNIPQGHVMSDIMFDNIFSDMAQHDRIKDSQASTRKEARTLNDMLKMAQQRSVEYQQEADAALGRLEIARKELQQIRQDTFKRLAQPPAYEQRPPAYERAVS